MTNHCGSRRGCNYLTHNSRCDQALLGSGLEGISSVGGGRILKIDAHSKWFFFCFFCFFYVSCFCCYMTLDSVFLGCLIPLCVLSMVPGTWISLR